MKLCLRLRCGNVVLKAPNKPAWEYGDANGYDDTNEASTSVSEANNENVENGEGWLLS